jgi:serine/threonine-protein kinase
MAPEQILGVAVTPRTDLYALGCVAYWLLTGRKPFEADSRDELCRLHVHAAPPPLAEGSAHRVTPRLEALVQSCLAKDPLQRPRDADEVSLELANCVEGPPWSDTEAGRWWNEHMPA